MIVRIVSFFIIIFASSSCNRITQREAEILVNERFISECVEGAIPSSEFTFDGFSPWQPKSEWRMTGVWTHQKLTECRLIVSINKDGWTEVAGENIAKLKRERNR